MSLREASFALRVVQRRTGLAGILYRRTLTARHEERLTRIAAISSLAFTAGLPLLRAGVRASGGPAAKPVPGPYHALDADWGARIACYALVASGLRNAEGLSKTGRNLKEADGSEAAWWLALMGRRDGKRAVRALRILTEAVK